MHGSTFSHFHFKNDEIKAARRERSPQARSDRETIGGHFEDRRERLEMEKGAIATGEKRSGRKRGRSSVGR
jgi:hypothetical protein